MRKNTILMCALLAAIPALAARDGKPQTSMYADHDHAAMMRGMGRPAAWTLYPTLKARTSGERRESMKTVIMPQHIVTKSIDAWSSDLEDAKAHRQLPMELGGAMLDKPATGGFNWLSAREEKGNSVRVASMVQPFGGRGGKNPTAMFMLQKNELEIIPQPYPREHSRYRANEDWKFLVRYNGKPLSAQVVYLETSNGSMSEFKSDAKGVFSIHVPDDFKPQKENKAAKGGHNHGRPGADFVLATEYTDGSKKYLTAFNSSYGPNAFDQRSLAMGLGFTLLGMVGAAPLLRKRKTEQKDGENGNA